MTQKLLSQVQIDEDKAISSKPKFSVKQQVKNDAFELAIILYEIYTKERGSARIISGRTDDIVS